MKKCPYCHADIQEDAAFCLYCMHSLTEKETIEAPKKRISKRIKAILCVALAVVIAAGTITFAFVKNSKICTFEKFQECFLAVNERLECGDLWNVSELKDYYVDKDWATYSLPLKNDDIELSIYFYKKGKEILTVIGEIPEEDLEDTRKMALCISDSIVGYYLTDFMDVLEENRNYRFSTNEFSYPENIEKDFRFIKEEDAEKANITSKHIASQIENSNIQIFYEILTFDYGNTKKYKMILYYYPEGSFNPYTE